MAEADRDVHARWMISRNGWHTTAVSFPKTGYPRTTKLIASMSQSELARLRRAVQAALPAGPIGSIEYFARTNAIKARVPR